MGDTLRMSGGVAFMSLIGRILLGLMFLMSGIHKVSDPQGTQQYMISMGMTWMTTLLYVGAIVAELAGGLSLLLGYRAKVGAWLLILFMIPTTLVFHTNFGDPNQMIHFMKNLSIIGGLLYVGMYGAGRLSMDAGLERTEAAGTERRTANLKKVVNR
jgi:putative oxidoreductase